VLVGQPGKLPQDDRAGVVYVLLRQPRGVLGVAVEHGIDDRLQFGEGVLGPARGAE
jgi:hypothetical protein